MPDPRYPTSERRKRTNLTVREDILAEAKALGLNTSRAAEAGIEAAIRDTITAAMKFLFQGY